mgnify:CR=1 FL=1
MRLFDKRTPLQKEWEKLEVQEQRFLQKRSEKRESILNQKLEEKIPPKLQKTLDTAFAKAFALIFEKGTGVIEKTYQRTKLEQDYQVRQYMADVKQNSKSLRSFLKRQEIREQRIYCYPVCLESGWAYWESVCRIFRYLQG